MENKSSPDDDINEDMSPTSKSLTFIKPSKRDTDSVGGVDDLLNRSSLTDSTLDFLQSETNNRDQHQSQDLFKQDEPLDDATSTDQISTISQNFSISQLNKIPSEEVGIGYFGEFLDQEEQGKTNTKEQSIGEAFNNFTHHHEQDSAAQFIANEQESDQHSQPFMDDRENDVLKGDNTSIDDLTFIPKKGGSSPLIHSFPAGDFGERPLTECKSSDKRELPKDNSATKIPESVLLKEFESKTQGDGFHVKENYDEDGSDIDDVAPEPIPKDYPEIDTIKGKQILTTMGLDAWLHPLLVNPKIESLVYWRDPKKSGVVFGSILIILLSLTTFSLISVVANCSLLVLIVALAFRIYKSVLQAVQKTSEGHPFKTYLLPVLNHPIISAVFLSVKDYLEFDLTLNPDRAKEISEVAVTYINQTLTKCRSLFLVEDLIDSLKFGICLWVLTYVGSWFNGLSLIIIGFVGLFTLPKVYETNKTQIDANLNVIHSKINEITEKLRAVIPLGKKTEDAKSKSE